MKDLKIQYHIFELSEWDVLLTKGESIAVFETELEAEEHIAFNLRIGSYIIIKIYAK